MPSDRTPEQWDWFCAREVMGAKEIRRHGDHFWQTPDRSWSAGMGWSPWNDPAAALEVLGRLTKIIAQRDNLPSDFDTVEISRAFGIWLVSIGGRHANAPGPHFGPAVCELAGKIIGEKHAQDK